MPEGTPAVTDAPPSDLTPAPTTPEPTPAPLAAEMGTSAEDTARLKVDVERWKALARQNELENSKTAKELDSLRKKSMTDQERAVAEANDSGYKRAVMEFGGKLVDAEIRAVATGRLDDAQLGFLFQGLNRSVFLNEDGSVDVKSVNTFVDGLAPKPAPPEDPPKSQFPDLGQGVRGLAPTALNGDPLLAALKAKVGAPRY